MGYSFVDDTDLIQTETYTDTYIDVLQGMQYLVDTWESGLKAMCDALVTEKNFLAFNRR